MTSGDLASGGRQGAPLGAVAKRLLLATFVGSLGSGLVLPFLVVYLSQVRGMATAIGGLVLAWSALLGFVVTPIGGWFIDRVGPKPVMLFGLAVESVSAAAWAFVREPWQAFAVGSLTALAGAGLWSAASTMLSRAVAEDQRQRVFGINFMLLNLGIGIGGLIAGLVVDVKRPGTFELLYLGDAFFILGGLAVLTTLKGFGGPVPLAADSGDDAPGGYRDVVADRALINLTLVSVVMLTCGYGAIEVGYPVFATTQAGLSAQAVAFGYVGNTVAIVLGQLYVIRLIQGRSRSRIIASVGLVWAIAWVLLGLAVPLNGLAAAAVALAAPAVFALGETLWQPVVPAIVNDLAPEHLRGRYNAVSSLSWNVAGTLGPAMTGILLGVGMAGVWIGVVVGGCLLAGVGGLGLRRMLTERQDGRFPAGVLEVEG